MEAKKERAGILLISEDLDEILSLSDWVAPMYEGNSWASSQGRKPRGRAWGMMAGCGLGVKDMRIGRYESSSRRGGVDRLAGRDISILAIIFALALFGSIFILAGINPLSLKETFSYAFANPFGLPLTMSRFIFLLLCTYAFIIPFRAGLWNIGMAGQLYAGALGAFAVLFAFGERVSYLALSPRLSS